MKKIRLSVAITILSLFIAVCSFCQDSTNIVAEVFNLTNKYRKSEGLPELINNTDLNQIAQRHSENMAAGSVPFGHDGFEGRNAQAKDKIKTMLSFAENVADGALTAKQVLDVWKNSPGHRRNILGDYKYIGIGIAKDKQGKYFFTQIFAG